MRDYAKPLYFTFNHEPESSASFANGEAPDFIAAWRKFHDIFVARGATNVKFMWIMTDYSFFVGSNARNDASKWYPGDAYLDAMGADAYNWYNCRTGINTPWWTLETIIRPFRDFGAAHPDKELWLSEYASTEDTASPGRKAQWINQAQALFKRSDYAQFHGIVYFDFQGPDNCRWFTDSSTTSASAFRTLAQDAFYGGPDAPPPPPPPPSEVTFVASAEQQRQQDQPHGPGAGGRCRPGTPCCCSSPPTSTPRPPPPPRDGPRCAAPIPAVCGRGSGHGRPRRPMRAPR